MFQDIFQVLHDDSKRHCNLKRDSESKLYLDNFLQGGILAREHEYNIMLPDYVLQMQIKHFLIMFHMKSS